MWERGFHRSSLEGTILPSHFSFDESVRLYIVEFHYNLGVAYMGKGLKNEAIMEFYEAVKIRPDYKKARKILQSLSR
jgi:hypothetical protein